jgi:hypothetical protein
MRRIENEYLDLTCCNTNHKVNYYLGIYNASLEIYPYVEDYPIKRIVVKTNRKHNYRQVKKFLCDSLNTDVANKIISEYLSPCDSIYIQFDIHQDPFLDNPEWKLRVLHIKGLNISEYIIQMVKAMNKNQELGLKNGLIFFMKKLDKLLKYV